MIEAFLMNILNICCLFFFSWKNKKNTPSYLELCLEPMMPGYTVNPSYNDSINFVPKDIASKKNLQGYRILNEQIDM